MRLINTQSLELEEFVGNAIPKYAILSHTWEKEEVTFQEWHDRDSIANKAGYKKIVAACEQARADRLQYIWVDTNCIDKKSSAELSEAINSMFAWYAGSNCCYVYLADLVLSTSSHAETTDPALIYWLDHGEQLRKCRWFSRGWTLQELLAPKTIIFFDANWQRVGDIRDGWLRDQISKITGIGAFHFGGTGILFKASVSTRMSWAARRETTREEDIAYCLLGIFGINMPLLYGEGRRAFLRLQEELVRVSNDQTIFCWSFPSNCSLDKGWDNVLAPHPYVFSEGGKYDPNSLYNTGYSLTNNGLEITLPAIRIGERCSIALLGANIEQDRLAIILERSGDLESRNYHERLRRIPPEVFQDG
ncbi:hypothetical protein GQX73_g8981 [Xylaria multiplex]|uniref:Heterokaryon incompatibility domain-containing protein n=1 Tax=Xylaria multiplex TaxID=323545 RepID=A0A7C8IIS3_9PEZI|nr:hypothetical protein GQX73_g8981 [Xylaria multiplex]